jgi:hypothetical protein
MEPVHLREMIPTIRMQKERKSMKEAASINTIIHQTKTHQSIKKYPREK